jgi:hypothetical protein
MQFIDDGQTYINNILWAERFQKEAKDFKTMDEVMCFVMKHHLLYGSSLNPPSPFDSKRICKEGKLEDLALFAPAYITLRPDLAEEYGLPCTILRLGTEGNLFQRWAELAFLACYAPTKKKEALATIERLREIL